MWNQARAIVWAQWKTLRNHFPRSNKAGLLFSLALGALWYGGFGFLSISLGIIMADSREIPTIHNVLPTVLLIAFLYWQVVPVLMVSMGSSLDLKKLLPYPIPHTQLFGIEVLLRVTTGFEVLIVLTGIGVGLSLNPRVPFWAPVWLLPFTAFNLFCSAGIRDLLSRLLGRKGIREIVVFLLVIAAALPQLIFRMGGFPLGRRLFAGEHFGFAPWTTAAQLVEGNFAWSTAAALLAWIAIAYAFGRGQFERGLRFDAAAAANPWHVFARSSGRRSPGLELLYSWPGKLFGDPLGALIEKDLRTLARSARFRLVFIMGFSFGLLVWLPFTLGAGRNGSFLSERYLILVSLYSLLLLSDPLFWNVFGFDRSAAQLYFLAPVKLSTVLLGKNLTAIFFVLLEVTLIAGICTLLRFPVSAVQTGETFLVSIVTALFLMGIGNVTSVYNPRAVNPAKSLRTAAGSRAQAVLMLAFPLALAPVLLAFAARYAFDSELAFCYVLLFAGALAFLFYRISVESAIATATRRREEIIAALSRGEMPIEA